ncbi:DUF2946 family protein [Caulobacter sp. CCNWLY153]|uniref:DUF2946 family protein n=1 Tax=unclassified Caulobacter TaxID=2648921 RepID=UPI002FF14F47
MTRPTFHRWTNARAVFMTLAALAVALKVLIPAGFMTAPEPRNGLPFALVLCTGQGAKVVAPGERLDHKKGSDEKPANAPCAFAALGVAMGAPPADLAVAPVEFVAYAAQPQPTRVVHLAPGRGLAAPPLPARGPPSLLI